MSLPGAAELFRTTQAPTGRPAADPAGSEAPLAEAPLTRAPLTEAPLAEAPLAEAPTRGSGRVRHEEKITIYVSGAELVALEQARLTLRARHGLAVDRGRIVREAVAAVIADLDAHGDDSELVRRLSPS